MDLKLALLLKLHNVTTINIRGHFFQKKLGIVVRLTHFMPPALKILENQRFLNVFRGYRKVPVALNVLNWSFQNTET